MLVEECRQPLDVVVPTCFRLDHVAFHRVVHDLEIFPHLDELLYEARRILEVNVVVDQTVDDEKQVSETIRIVDGARTEISLLVVHGKVQDSTRPCVVFTAFPLNFSRENQYGQLKHNALFFLGDMKSIVSDGFCSRTFHIESRIRVIQMNETDLVAFLSG